MFRGGSVEMAWKNYNKKKKKKNQTYLRPLCLASPKRIRNIIARHFIKRLK